ncbi:MAG TPA: hypothetical protein VKR83_14930, partial [Ktedonobacteraceae bacterium]|nr:hypothetical protein [Ktedonobacteraceae bacterium]
MVRQLVPLEEPLAAEIIPALIDLATLAQEAGSIAFEMLDPLAKNMLRRVLALCQAERGAVLLGEDLDIFEQSSALSTANAKGF